MNELEAPVEYIILPTFAYEHKIFVGPFSRKYPRAEVWVAPRQWSWPINLPLPLLGIFKAKIIRDDSTSAPWANEIDQKVLSCPIGELLPHHLTKKFFYICSDLMRCHCLQSLIYSNRYSLQDS